MPILLFVYVLYIHKSISCKVQSTSQRRFLLLHIFKNVYYWSIIDLQFCVNFLLYRKMIQLCCFCLVTKSCDCSLPGFSFHGTSQAVILEWVAISFCRGSSRPSDWTHVSCIGMLILYCWATWEDPFIIFSLWFITRYLIWFSVLYSRPLCFSSLYIYIVLIC